MDTVELRDRIPRPVKPMEDGGGENEDGPRRPKVDKPGGGDDILKRMKRVDPNQARRYRQRTGQ
jgi:hypothetical protein